MRIQLLTASSLRRRSNQMPSPLLLVAVALLAFSATVWLFAPNPAHEAAMRPYRYKGLMASNGILLHTIAVKPDNIGLKAIDTNVTETRDYGINGGFFWEGQLLSIAVINDWPVKGAPGDYGSGWYNIDRPRGTLVWDGLTGGFSVQVTDRAEELQVSSRSRYWAQGGVSMGLRNEPGWKEQALAEEFPAMEENRLRSGMVYDSEGMVWLLVTTTPCTGPAFREAVKEKIAPGKLVDGIFLDGDGSSQLQLDHVRLAGDHRAVFQMITLPRR
jgi:hypothetical protein